jgi:thiosulfate/3-mercaptopyruvate sulfurtransferase
MAVELDPIPSSRSTPSRAARHDRVARRTARRPRVVVAESDEDVLLYDTGHIPGAVKIDWHQDLNDGSSATASMPRASPG